MERRRGRVRVGPHAELPLVPLRAVQVEPPKVAVPGRNSAAQMPEVYQGNRYFKDPALVRIAVIIESAVVGRRDLHAFALPRRMDVFGPFRPAAKGDIIEQHAVDVHLVPEVGTDVVGGRRGENLYRIFLVDRTVVRGDFRIQIRIVTDVDDVQVVVIPEHRGDRVLRSLDPCVGPRQSKMNRRGGAPIRVVGATVDTNAGVGAVDGVGRHLVGWRQGALVGVVGLGPGGGGAGQQHTTAIAGNSHGLILRFGCSVTQAKGPVQPPFAEDGRRPIACDSMRTITAI